MALPKVIWFGVILLAMFYNLDQRGFRRSVSFFKDLLGSETSRLHVREKRDVSTNISDGGIQNVVTLSDLERPRMILSNPISINSTEITNIQTTTVTTLATPTSTLMNVKTGVVLELFIPVSSDLWNLTEIRNLVKNLQLPLTNTKSLTLTSMNITTACSPLQCQCEEGFAWPCDMCVNNSCSQVKGQTCSCVNGLPANQFCQPITNSSLCPTPVIPTTPTPTPTPVTTTTPPTPVSKSDSFTLNLNFDSSYNQETNPVYINVKNATLSSCHSVVSMSCSLEKLLFTQGSTIVTYTLSAATISDIQAGDVKTQVLNTLSNYYPVWVFGSLTFDPPAIILNQRLTVTCGPPPSNLSVSTNWNAVWTLNGAPITSDGTHSFSSSNAASILTVSEFHDADNGNYDCQLIFQNNIIFDAKGSFQAQLVLLAIQNLLNDSKNLNESTLSDFLQRLQGTTANNTKFIIGSPDTISAIVTIFSNVANATSAFHIELDNGNMTNILASAGILTIDGAKSSWDTLNQRDLNSTGTNSNTDIKSVSSSLLNTFENFTSRLVNGPLNIITPSILLNKTTLGNDFVDDANSSVKIDIPQINGGNKSITIVLFASMNNVLPARNDANATNEVINGKVALIKSEADIRNITLTFQITNTTLGNPQCVFWDFTLLNGLGGWSSNGCSLVFTANGSVSCHCNHTTSFSILMSPESVDDPALDYITYIGVGISIACLIICLIIEGVIWRKIRRNATSYLRHVSIVNIAVSLLIADIWFIVGAGVSRANPTSPSACTAVTFFVHFFYLALFFWMLASALLLLYRTVSVFEGGLTKRSMLVIGFSLGYGAPLLIATITIAATAPSNEYIRANNICWLNWAQSKALLAFVVPALLIVVINLVILVVVLYKMLRSRSGRHAPGEKHALIVIARSLAVLTPFFGITWGLGIGTMVAPKDRGILITFALFNSLQGLFILMFGTLLDKKVLSGLSISALSSQGRTTSTTAGSSS